MSQATIRIGKSTDNDYVIPADAPGVSRHHARLVCEVDGRLFIEDADSANGTFVNGDRIVRKRLGASDTVTLGDTYTLDVREALKFDNDYTAEFAALKPIYDGYIRRKIRIQSSNQFKTRLFQTLPFAAVGIVGLIVGSVGRSHRVVFLVSLVLTIVAPLLGVYLGARQSAKIPALLQDLANQFKIDYVCPKCGTFLGEIPWESLAKKKRCPTNGCRAKWVNDNKP